MTENNDGTKTKVFYLHPKQWLKNKKSRENIWLGITISILGILYISQTLIIVGNRFLRNFRNTSAIPTNFYIILFVYFSVGVSFLILGLKFNPTPTKPENRIWVSTAYLAKLLGSILGIILGFVPIFMIGIFAMAPHLMERIMLILSLWFLVPLFIFWVIVKM